MNRKTRPYGLGVYKSEDEILLYHTAPFAVHEKFMCSRSTDGYNFSNFTDPVLVDHKKRIQSVRTISDFRISKFDKSYYLVYKLISQANPDIRIAKSDDLKNWQKLPVASGIKETGQLIPNYLYKNQFVLLHGEGDIFLSLTTDFKTWQRSGQPVLSRRQNYFDNGILIPALVYMGDTGLVVYYYVRHDHTGSPCYSLGKAIINRDNPFEVLARSQVAILDHVEGFTGKNVMPVGIVKSDGRIITYWDVEAEGIAAIGLPPMVRKESFYDKTVKVVLQKMVNNPILKPVASRLWESKAVFNPAAIYDSGKIHLIYRAVGENDVSVLGYATTVDGINIDERLPEPVYVPRADFEKSVFAANKTGSFNIPYFSGGAYGGIEDPRLTRIEDTYYLMYVAYNGSSPPRVAMSSISVADFRDRNWSSWSDPVLISSPGQVNKNACLLPEKINGKYVIFHRIYPNILIDYVDDLDRFDGQNYFLTGQYKIGPRPNMWDSNKVGIGAPPIKTDQGWLLVYQSVGYQDPHRYKIGAMLLSADCPEKVLYRTREPILEPDRWYENEGFKSGVAYPCGAVIHNNNLRVYYGGADTVVCHASAPIKPFMDSLCSNAHMQLYASKVLSAS